MILEGSMINKKTYLKIAVQMDNPQYLDKEGDSTLALIEEALKKKFSVYIYLVNDLSLIGNKPVANMKKVKSLNIKSENFIKLENPKLLSLNDFSTILVRQDPPFNMDYITSTHILDKVDKKVKIINNPSAIRNSPEKLFVTNFYHMMPPTIITKNINAILKFVKEFKKSVIKPLYGNGGKDVFLLAYSDPNLNVILEKLLTDGQHLIVQKFINEVRKGDKRILLIDGEPVGAINRVPKGKEIRANLHIGAFAYKAKLSKRDLLICKEIGPVLKNKGLYFTGIDVINGLITEINVTSPTCIREMDKFNKTNIAKIFWEKVQGTQF